MNYRKIKIRRDIRRSLVNLYLLYCSSMAYYRWTWLYSLDKLFRGIGRLLLGPHEALSFPGCTRPRPSVSPQRANAPSKLQIETSTGICFFSFTKHTQQVPSCQSMSPTKLLPAMFHLKHACCPHRKIYTRSFCSFYIMTANKSSQLYPLYFWGPKLLCLQCFSFLCCFPSC